MLMLIFQDGLVACEIIDEALLFFFTALLNRAVPSQISSTFQVAVSEKIGFKVL